VRRICLDLANRGTSRQTLARKRAAGTFRRVTLTLLFAFAIILLDCHQACFAQLSENCTVSVLNRNVPVNPDGTWVLANIPANFGRVRARANCVVNGVTTTGESDFFLVPVNGSVTLIPITLGSSTPIPVSLALTSPQSQLTAVGATVQLQASASFAVGPVKDVTAANSGTDYTISNPAIATITADGLVTAVSSGTVVIQASNEGTSGILSLQVVLSGTSHGGVPDDWAIAHGLNPNDPAMPFEDPDHDGLTNLQEFQQGTDPHNPDTDGDGLSDGDEVLKYHTNPLLPDTDGDGIPDGVEVATGTDPLDPTSYDLNKAVQSLEIKPSTFVLTVNSIVGEASVQLSVLGHLIDGKTTIDLTSTTPAKRGTNYNSSDLTICNFGTPDGNVFAGSNGSCTITATNNGHTASAQGTVSSFSPTALSSVNIPGHANNVTVNGNFAYVAAGSTGLQIVDVSDRTNPRIVSSVDTPGNANDVQLAGNLAYVADGSSGIQVIDVTQPLAPVLIGSFKTAGVAWDAVVTGGVAYVAVDTSGVQIVDVSNPAAPIGLGIVALPGITKGLDIDASRNLVVAVGTGGLFTITVANPKAPALVGSLNYTGALGLPADARDVALQGNFAFVADFNSNLTSVDITNPAQPIYVASAGVSSTAFLEDVVISGNFAFGADALFGGGVPIVNIGNPSVLQALSVLTFPSGDSRGFKEAHATGIAVDAAYIYLTASHDPLDMTENGVTGDTGLFIGRYVSPVDTNGIPPNVQITSPVNGSTVVRGSQLQIAVQASDDVAVAAVNLFVNGQEVFTTTSTPYQFTYPVPLDATSLTIGAQAVDFGENTGTASAVIVNAISDPLTTAQGRVVDSTNVPVAGANVVCQAKTAASAADGTFNIAGLSTIQGPIQCTATATVAGALKAGVSNSFAPVGGGVTSIGTIIISGLGSRGQDFWLAFPENIGQGGEIVILTDGTANYTVSNSSTGFNVTDTVTAQSPAVIPVPSSLMISSNQTTESKGIHVTSTDIVSVFFYFPVPSDIYLGIPTPSLGTEFFALDYAAAATGFLSRVTVTAPQDATQVTISNACGSSTPITTTLNSGQTYSVACGDVSGAHVVSNNPVVAVASNDCASIPGLGSFSCNMMAENMFPVGPLWGTEIYSAPLPGDGNGFDAYRVIAARDGTIVTVDQGGGNVQSLTLNQGQFQELHFKAGAHFTSNLPILVMQYPTGFLSIGVAQPSDMQLVPVTSFNNSSSFYSPPDLGWTSYAVIIAPNIAVGSVQLNGSTVSGFTPLPGGAYQYAVITVPAGQNSISSPQPIGVYSIGFVSIESYSTPTRF
jgi:hypothetical protein